MRSSKILTRQDAAGPYEIEVFDCPNPKGIIVCSHGNGVRRWDGEKFFYEVAEHFPEYVVLLVDQNQPYEDGCKLNPLPILISRVQGLMQYAKENYPGKPTSVIGHSMGCGVASKLDLTDVIQVIFEAPTVGNEHEKLIKRYGEDVLEGKVVRTSDGLTKFIAKDYVQSVKDLDWGKIIGALSEGNKPVFVFEAGEEEIVSDERKIYRSMPFTSYKIIPGAKHNLSGRPLQDFFKELDRLF